MADTLTHRGPDDGDVWVDGAAGTALGFRRLSILDLSPAGRQPMVSPSGRRVIVFNGEIYNHAELRSQLEGNGPAFRGRSDTEVLLAAIERWGVDAALRRCVGMFALAVWDRTNRCLTLARDRIGEKPLYFGQVNGVLLFGSELKSLAAHPRWQARINRGAIAQLLQRRTISAPSSIFHDVAKLRPGSLVTFDIEALRDGAALPEPTPYWDPLEAVRDAIEHPLPDDGPAIEAQLGDALGRAVTDQMVADVPLGAFLSGGIDSATIVALMQAASTQPVNTFTVAFDDERYNEGDDASAVAKWLGTNHTELRVTAAEARELIPRLPTLYDEPMGDFSAIPMYLVAQLARRHVTVCLSGDGGDELFCGYRRYVQGGALWRWMRCLPLPARRLLGRLLASSSPELRQAGGGWLEPYLRRQGGARRASDQLETLSYLLGARHADDLYRRMTSDWRDLDQVLQGEFDTTASGLDVHAMRAMRASRLPAELPLPSGVFRDARSRMMIRDLLGYLPDDILTKVDRATMGASLESRTPFLDHRVVEFAWRIPLRWKVRAGQGKWILRQVLYRHVPRELVDRPKKGFTPPLADWLRGPLRDWAEALLDPHRLASDGLFHAGPVREKWEQHLRGTHNWATPIWNLLTFLSWREHHAAWENQRPSAGKSGIAA